MRDDAIAEATPDSAPASQPGAAGRLKGCPRCGLVHVLPAMGAAGRGGSPGLEARCVRCGSVIFKPGGEFSNRLAGAIALAALLVFPLGVGLPIMSISQMGRTHVSSIWEGVFDLFAHGQLLVGVVVTLCSLVIPPLKLVGVFVLAARVPLAGRHRSFVYRLIELTGRWGMVDVLLVAILVAVFKLQDLVEVEPGPGLWAFTIMVVLSLLASACFDPHELWETEV